MSLVKKYSAEVISFTNHFENVYSVEFKSLSGKFRYSPGQFLHLALDEYDPSMGWPESRCFSIQTPPSSEHIRITFAVKGKYTGRMESQMRVGCTVNLKLPYGELFQREHSGENVIFIAGGTGITPFLSLFNDQSFARYTNPKLYFGIKKETHNIYKNELSLAGKINESLQMKIVREDLSGMLDINKIYLENGNDSVYFISGPPLMISKFKSELKSYGVNERNILTDEWN